MSALAERLKSCTPAELYEQIMVEQFRADPSNKERFQGTDCVIQIRITGAGGGAWALEITGGELRVEAREHPEPGLTLEMAYDAWRAVTAGTLHPQQAFMEGKMLISGDMSLAMHLGQLLRMEA